MHATPVRGYMLALSWAPQFCRNRSDSDECNPAVGQFGFILHGLWPEGDGRDSPQWCAAAGPLPADVARGAFCSIPSGKLMAHEWAKHGVCASKSPADYFAAARKMYEHVYIPDMTALSYRQIDVGGFKRVLAAANPWLPASSIIVTNERQGDWLREVRICLDAKLRAQPCPRDWGGGAPDGAKLKIWRAMP